MQIGKTLQVERSDDWRAWLEKNCLSEKEIWLVMYKKSSGLQKLSYDNAVEEALCFGWIDSTGKRIDDKRLALRFSPRKEKSNWSLSNIERVKKLVLAGKMTEEGKKKFNKGVLLALNEKN